VQDLSLSSNPAKHLVHSKSKVSAVTSPLTLQLVHSNGQGEQITSFVFPIATTIGNYPSTHNFVIS